MKRTILTVVCLTLLTAACVTPPVYVRPYQPQTRADSLAIRADSLAWALQQQQKRSADALTSIDTWLICLVLIPAAAALFIPH